MPEPLQDALYRLLHHRSFRSDWIAGRHDALGLEPRVLGLLRAIDVDELQTLSASICRNLLRGELRLEGGLKATFAETLSLLERAGYPPLEIIYRFAESPEYAGARQLPYPGPGVSVEEALFDFLRREESLLASAPGASLMLTHEFLTGMLAILVQNPEPSFELGSSLIRWNGAAHVAVLRYPIGFARGLTERAIAQADDSGQVIYLYAAAPGRLLRGPTSAVVAALVERGRDGLEATLRALAGQGVPTTVAALSAVADGLAKLGLIP
jgi:hypothetical protein